MTRLFKNFIGGEWVGGDTAADNINPSNTDDVVGTYVRASRTDAQLAIDSAKAAFANWSKSNPQTRHDVLKKVADEILSRKAELGELLAREEGKTLPEAVGEVARAGQIFAFFSGEALRQSGEKLASVRAGVEVDITREPLGVIGVITPWNFPIAIPAWKIAPALCYGNTVVFKPAELVTGSAWALAEILSRSGLPAGVFNLVMGHGRDVGQTLLDHRDVTALTFTGSVATGMRVAQACVQRMAKFQLEMGGKNPLVVLDDANLSSAVENAVNGAFYSTGQRCTASSRLIVTAGVYDEFVAALVDRTKALVVDDALKAGSHIGPVVDAAQLEQNQSYLRIAQDEGATLLWGGERMMRDTPGFYMAPAIFTDCTNRMRVCQEEVFGPIVSVIRVSDYEEALAVANDTPFGLAAGICTTSLKYANHFKQHAEAGMVMVNLPTAGVDYHVPFGGRKGSSYGPREQGRYAAEFFTSTKTAYVLP
ncbi:MAG: aldehyde dehydrogenase family protein [Paraburkholderia sp.]|uniref:aldehyde dehydrogenase family protein n=2 Tax=Paraburkholderia sp. TaxID=1926495 RepID=UPI0039780DEE